MRRVESASQSESRAICEVEGALECLRRWIEERDFAGHDPYDLLNSPILTGTWRYSRAASVALIQLGRRFGSRRLRELLQVPRSKNPKALGLILAAYSALASCGQDAEQKADYLKAELKRLCAPGEAHFSWGYDWNFVSLRGSTMRAFAANSIATVFCAEALLDSSDVFADRESEEMALSACRFCVTRLRRTWDKQEELCFSYTPEDRTLIYNNSILIGALLARVGTRVGNQEYVALARRTMQYVVTRQRGDGAWAYGAAINQQWVDGFHTGYNLCALSEYRRHTNDPSFDDAIARGYEFYAKCCFSAEGIPRYFEDKLYPIDIHACAQAVITHCEFAERDQWALRRAIDVAMWTIRNMRSEDGSFYYQRHKFWTNRTAYMRWGQAWMFRALTKLLIELKRQENDTLD